MVEVVVEMNWNDGVRGLVELEFLVDVERVAGAERESGEGEVEGRGGGDVVGYE